MGLIPDHGRLLDVQEAIGEDAYPTKERLMEHLNASLTRMKENGSMPPDAEITDVRVNDIEFLIKSEIGWPGKFRSVMAKMVTEDEMEREKPSFFGGT